MGRFQTDFFLKKREKLKELARPLNSSAGRGVHFASLETYV